MELYLVRHGQSEYNIGLTLHLDSALTPLGRSQAQRTGERLREEGLTRAFVSPLRRTLETMSFISAACDLRAEVNAQICEFFSAANHGYRNFPGLTPDAIRQEFPFAVFGDTFPCNAVWWPQDPEDDDRIYARCEQVRDTLLRHFAGTDERLLIVSHADTVGWLTEAFLRVPTRPDAPPWNDNCGISRLRIPANPSQPAELLTQNETGHLAGLAE